MTEENKNRKLGDEWLDWDGKDDDFAKAGKTLYLAYVAVVFLVWDFLVLFLTYLITPRLMLWSKYLPAIAWFFALLFVVVTTLWCVQLGLTAVMEKRVFFFKRSAKIAFKMTFGAAFRLASLVRINKDRLGNSFVKVSNSITKSLFKPKKSKILILLPRCISKDQIISIQNMKSEYDVDVAVVGGGEQARKKVQEIRPNAVIGVACERDLVAGIKDIADKVSVIGIPNERPEGPCKNTYVDINEIKKAIEFYLS